MSGRNVRERAASEDNVHQRNPLLVRAAQPPAHVRRPSAVVLQPFDVLQYEFQYHSGPRSERMCSFLSVGGGMKWFQGIGEETAYQPLMPRAYLTHTRELKPLLTDGAGSKFYTARRMILDVDLGHQITGFPSQIIASAPGMGITGWLDDFVPTVGLS